jgi:hypothetical protein
MKEDTLRVLKEVLKSEAVPKCIFIVHPHKDQIVEIADDIGKKTDLFKTGGRKVMHLWDTDTLSAADKFIKDHRADIRDKKG